MEDSFVPHRVELLQLIADTDDHVRLVETEVDVVVAHEPHSTQCVWVIVREHTLAVKGGGDRDAELFGEALQGGRGAAPGRSVPGEHDWAASPVEHGRRPSDLRRREIGRASGREKGYTA